MSTLQTLRDQDGPGPSSSEEHRVADQTTCGTVGPQHTHRWGPDAYVTLGLLLVTYGVFNLVLVNAYFPITEGWFQDFGNIMSRGQVMYRDFYMFIPPGYPALMALIGRLTGNLFLAFRLYGILERLVLVGLVFILMRRFFKPHIAFVAVLTAAVVYAANVQDVFAGYYQSSLLLAVITLYFTVRMYETFDRDLLRYPLLTGVFAGLLVLFKQSTGVIAPFLLAVAFLILTIRTNRGRALKQVGVALAAYAAVLALAAGLLALNHALIPCIEQVFGGSSSKGSFGAVLFGFLPRILTSESLTITLWSLAVALIVIARRAPGPRNRDLLLIASTLSLVLGIALVAGVIRDTRAAFGTFAHVASYPTLAMVLLLGGVVLTLILPLLGARPSRRVPSRAVDLISTVIIAGWMTCIFLYVRNTSFDFFDFLYLRTQRQHLVYALFFLVIAYSAYALYQVIARNREEYSTKLLVATAASSVMYIHGMSFNIEDHAVLLALSLLLGVALSSRLVLNSLKNVAVYLLCFVLVVPVTVQRNALPYHWWGVKECPPTYLATSTFDDPHLAGLLSSTDFTEDMNEIYALIEANRRDGDTMYTFPHITYFNVMADLPSPTFAKVAYFDVCTDDVAERDAAALLESPPDFLVWLNLTAEEWQFHEYYFRADRPSGQRALDKAYRQLVASGGYVHLGSFHVGASNPIDIYVKRDREVTFPGSQSRDASD